MFHLSDILGAYANFLWEISKDEEDDGEQQDDNESQLFQVSTVHLVSCECLFESLFLTPQHNISVYC